MIDGTMLFPAMVDFSASKPSKIPWALAPHKTKGYGRRRRNLVIRSGNFRIQLPTVNLDEFEKHTQRYRVTEYDALGTLLAVISFGLSDPEELRTCLLIQEA
jgi:hypothetical protein